MVRQTGSRAELVALLDDHGDGEDDDAGEDGRPQVVADDRGDGEARNRPDQTLSITPTVPTALNSTCQRDLE
jgi:hypothetical protein